jgi:rhamnosyltransferase
MTANDVLAVVVSYNGVQKTIETVHALRSQVGHIHIVDNGSAQESLVLLDSLEEETGISVERLGENRGVGCALNCGVQRARTTGSKWLLTMDQDSVVDNSFLAAYQAALEETPDLVCLAPRITARSRKKDAEGGVVQYAITSGNLVRVSLFDQIGMYDEGFFVDCIDFDFCLRLRRAGYEVHRVAEAEMQHQLGDSVDLPEAVRGYYSRHSPVRRYYMYRNYLYLAERYMVSFPVFILKLGLLQMFLSVLVGFLDESPLASYRAILRALWDYGVRVKGPYLEHAA